MLTKDFWYELPPEQIAQHPVSPRDHARLMHCNRRTRQIEHRQIFELPELLDSKDLLVWNDTRVFKARLRGKTKNSGHSVECLLLHPEGDTWIALAKPARKLNPQDPILFSKTLTAFPINKYEDGTVRLQFHQSSDAVFKECEQIGEIPIPPYIQSFSETEDAYQTVYAKQTGSAAAPTAGLHFTPKLLEEIRKKQIQTASVTLHIGLGTFRPIKCEHTEDHVMHEEWYSIPKETAEKIKETKKNKGRIIAVGTTSVRALESAARNNPEKEIRAQSGKTNLFLKPGDPFLVTDALLTNFHLPASTLLMLVCAFAQTAYANKNAINWEEEKDLGRQFVLKAYQEAIQKKYRFYSFGDAMFMD